jgi:polyisoprenoid-binding protein YceI
MRFRAAATTGVFCLAVLAFPLAAEDLRIDPSRSTIVIHVGKAGLLSAAAHNHLIDASIASGVLGETGTPHIEFTVNTAQLAVRPDPAVDAKTQATIQSDMEDMTLETKKFPSISFRSTKVESAGDGRWTVTGDLTIHGITRSVTLAVNRAGDAYATHTVLKQTDFGIRPISLGGGTIRVKNEIEIDFRIVPGRN